jgi:hypothetical protein
MIDRPTEAEVMAAVARDARVHPGHGADHA